MCLAVPGKIVRWLEREPPFEQAIVEFGGLERHVWMSCIDDAGPGDFVLVHAGIAIGRLDTDAAERTLAALAEVERIDIASSTETTDAGETGQ